MAWSVVWANAYAAAIASGQDPKHWLRIADLVLTTYKMKEKRGDFEQ